jgi:hypothetical protein
MLVSMYHSLMTLCIRTPAVPTTRAQAASTALSRARKCYVPTRAHACMRAHSHKNTQIHIHAHLFAHLSLLTWMQSLFKRLGTQPANQPTRMSVESGKAMFHYLLDSGAIFLTLTEKGWEKEPSLVPKQIGRLVDWQIGLVWSTKFNLMQEERPPHTVTGACNWRGQHMINHRLSLESKSFAFRTFDQNSRTVYDRMYGHFPAESNVQCIHRHLYVCGIRMTVYEGQNNTYMGFI